MRIRLLTGAGFLAFLMTGALCAAATKPAIDAPPAGLVPTTATLTAILKASADTDDSKPANPRIEDWTIVSGGLQGTEHIVHAGRDMADTTRLGPFTYAYGRFHGQHWEQNENGLTVLMDGLHERDATSAQALRSASLAATPSTNVTLLGETTGPAPCYVVEVKPDDGRHEWAFFDKASGQIDRIESVREDVRVVDTYDDYRKTNGFLRPWHMHESDGRPDNEEDDHLISERAVATVPPAELAIPGNRRTLDEFPDGVHRVDLPVRMIGSDIVVRVTIAGRGLDFILDSGASGIVIDRGVAQQLGLATYGRRNVTTAGPYTESQTLVPEMDVGTIALRNVMVTSLPFNYEADESTRIVGLLGFDFIADTTLKIDYDGGKVTALDQLPSQELPSDSIQIPLTLDDEVPIVSARVGGASGNFVVDTGAQDMMLFSDFAVSHPDDVKDQGLGKDLSVEYPGMSAAGVGGEFQITPVELNSFSFGSVAFRDILVYMPHDAPAFEGEDTAGLIGFTVLRTFDVWFDYRSGTMYLAPNAAARKYLKKLPASTAGVTSTL